MKGSSLSELLPCICQLTVMSGAPEWVDSQSLNKSSNSFESPWARACLPCRLALSRCRQQPGVHKKLVRESRHQCLVCILRPSSISSVSLLCSEDRSENVVVDRAVLKFRTFAVAAVSSSSHQSAANPVRCAQLVPVTVWLYQKRCLRRRLLPLVRPR